jgi:hypothetical protein
MMMNSRALAALVVATVAGGTLLAAEGKVKKPTLELRVTPRMAFSPVTILMVAELKGGDDIEQYYCPEIEWDWDDGGKSVHEADCPPFETGTTTIDRRFSQEHHYPRAGIYNVKASFKRSGNTFLASTIRVTVRAGAGDPGNVRDQND